MPVVVDVAECSPVSPDGLATEQLVHEEIARLPDSCRRPLVLCCLEGLSYDLAAQQLGVNPSTVRGRLERARKRLSSRLRQRGVSTLVAAGPALESARATLPPLPSSLIESTVAFSLRWSRVTGLLGGGTVVPESIAALAHGVIQSMVFQTLRVSAAALLAVGVIGTAVVAQQGKRASGRRKCGWRRCSRRGAGRGKEELTGRGGARSARRWVWKSPMARSRSSITKPGS